MSGRAAALAKGRHCPNRRPRDDTAEGGQPAASITPTRSWRIWGAESPLGPPTPPRASEGRQAGRLVLCAVLITGATGRAAATWLELRPPAALHSRQLRRRGSGFVGMSAGLRDLKAVAEAGASAEEFPVEVAATTAPAAAAARLLHAG